MIQMIVTFWYIQFCSSLIFFNGDRIALTCHTHTPTISHPTGSESISFETLPSIEQAHCIVLMNDGHVRGAC